MPSFIIAVSVQDNMKYAIEGTRVHDALELYYKTGQLDPENEDMLWPVIELIDSVWVKNSEHLNSRFEAEPSFCHKSVTEINTFAQNKTLS